ncbi:MAG: metal ABC transporter ATP-binding protein [Acidimicrobiales bacterium]
MTTTGDLLVDLDGVGCDLGSGPILYDIELAVRAGDFVGIVGPSGSGKTTLLRIALGAVAPTTGQVRKGPRLRLGYVPQVETINWNFPVTVAEVVLMARTEGRVLPWASRSERHEVAAVLDRLGIGDLADRHIRALSGGQQQRVFIARALLGRADLLLLDEPTSGVDVRTRHEVLHVLDELHHEGLAILLTTHDLNGVATHLPHLVCLNQTVIATGTPHEVLRPQVLEATYGAPLDVLQHAGLPFVVDRPHHHRPVEAEAS